jgi:hypothetical protein
MIPNHVRGRVFSTEFAMLTLMNASAATLGGWGMDHPKIGMQTILYSMTSLTIFFGMIWLFWIWISKRKAASQILSSQT